MPPILYTSQTDSLTFLLAMPHPCPHLYVSIMRSSSGVDSLTYFVLPLLPLGEAIILYFHWQMYSFPPFGVLS